MKLKQNIFLFVLIITSCLYAFENDHNNKSKLQLSINGTLLFKGNRYVTEFGPTIKIGGVLNNKHYLGGIIDYAPLNIKDDYYSNDISVFLLGGAIEYLFLLTEVESFTTGIGIDLGFWGHSVNAGADWDMYFGGPKFEIKVGPNNVLFNASSTLLIGYGPIKPTISSGITIKLSSRN